MNHAKAQGIFSKNRPRVNRVCLRTPNLDSAIRVRHLLPERPEGCFAQKVPDTFSRNHASLYRLGQGQFFQGIEAGEQLVQRDLLPAIRLVPQDGQLECLERFRHVPGQFAKLLERADRFHRSLNFKSWRKKPCEIILFGGDTEWTLTKAILKKDAAGRWRTRFWDPRLEDKLLTPGDNMVTRESMLGVRNAGFTKRGWQDSPMDISFSLFVTQRHENIHKDATFQDNLLHILLGN